MSYPPGMRRLGMRSVIVLLLAVAFTASGAPANASDTSVTRTPRFDFGCQLEEESWKKARCARNGEQARQGRLRAREVVRIRHTYALIGGSVEPSTLSDSTGVVVHAPALSNVVVTVVARGKQAAASPLSGLRLCVGILDRHGNGYSGKCEPIATDAATTLTSDFDGFALAGTDSQYRVIVFLKGSGHANVRSITYRFESVV